MATEKKEKNPYRVVQNSWDLELFVCSLNIVIDYESSLFQRPKYTDNIYK